MYNRNRIIETPEEQAAKIIFPTLKDKTPRQIEERLALLNFEECEALLEEARKDTRVNYTIGSFSLFGIIKAYNYQEKTRRRIAADPMLQNGGFAIPVPTLTNTRAEEAKKNAALINDDTCAHFLETAIMQSRRKCLDKRFGVYQTFADFEERELVELQERGMSYRLAYFLVKGWDTDEHPDMEKDWESYQQWMKRDLAGDTGNYRRDLEKGNIETPSLIVELGSYAIKDLEAICKELKPVCHEYQFSLGKGIKTPHLLHIEYRGAGLLKFRGGSGITEKELCVVTNLHPRNYSQQSFQVAIALEQISQFIAVKPQRWEDKKVKGRWKRVLRTDNEGYVNVALDVNKKLLILRESGCSARLKLIELRSGVDDTAQA